MSKLTVADCVYTPCFCEENAYKLCQQLIHQPIDLYVVFISNRNRQVGSFRHRLAFVCMLHTVDLR